MTEAQVGDVTGREQAQGSADETGQGLVEYALIVVFVTLVCVAGLTALGVAVNGFFGSFAF